MFLNTMKRAKLIWVSSQSCHPLLTRTKGNSPLSIMSFSITTLCIKGLFATFSIMTLSITTLCNYAERQFAECRVLFLALLNVILLSFNMMNVIMPSVVMPNVVMVTVMALNRVTSIF